MTVRVTRPPISVRGKLDELDKPSGVAGETAYRSNTTEDLASVVGASRRNLIINGDFQVWQRGTSVAINGGNDHLTADRWYLYANQSAFDRSTDVPERQGFTYSMKASGFTSNLVMDTSVELPVAGDPWIFHEGSVFTLTFWAKAANYAGRIMTRGLFRQQSGSSTNEVSPAGFYDHGKSMQLDGEWKKHTIIYRMPNISLGSGITAFHLSFRTTNGSSLETPPSNAEVYITGVQLVQGAYSDGLPFLHRSFGEELALCKRYFQKSTEQSVFPANGPDTNNFAGGMGSTLNLVGLAIWSNPEPIQLPVEMRAYPTMTRYGNSQGYWGYVHLGTAGPSGLSTTNFHSGVYIGGTPKTIYVNNQVSTNPMWGVKGMWTADAEL